MAIAVTDDFEANPSDTSSGTSLTGLKWNGTTYKIESGVKYYKHCITITTLPSGASDTNNGIIRTYCISKNSQAYTQYADFRNLLLYQPVICINYRSGYNSSYRYSSGIIESVSTSSFMLFGTVADSNSNTIPADYSKMKYSEIIAANFTEITDQVIEL